MSLQQSSPSFCTDEEFMTPFLTLSSKQVSDFFGQGGQMSRDLFRNNLWDAEQSESQINGKDQINHHEYQPSLMSYEGNNQFEQDNRECQTQQQYSNSIKNSIQQESILSNSSKNNFNQNNLNLTDTNQFTPEIKDLIHHINFLQSQLFTCNRHYHQLKTFTSSLINSIRTTLSKQVASQLQHYLEAYLQVQTPQFQQKLQQSSMVSFLSKQFMDKINSESLEYSKEFNERQMSKTIEGMFTLGENGFRYSSNGTDSIAEESYTNEKTTEKKNSKSVKNTKDFKKHKSTTNDNKIMTFKQSLNTSKGNTNKKPTKNKQNYEDSFINLPKSSTKKHKNSVSLSYPSTLSLRSQTLNLLADDKSSTSTKVSNKQSHNISLTARKLLCQVCNLSYFPAQFFTHLLSCMKDKSEHMQSLPSAQTQKITLNYTLMIENLMTMREQIEDEIQLLKGQKQQTKQQEERELLKKKLEKDLEKVTKIIYEKEKEMKIKLEQSLRLGDL